MLKKILLNYGLFIILILSIFTVLPFFHAGFFPMHDNTQVQRVFELNKALKDGMFPVRWSNDLGFGYGYPLFTFYAPLSYYLGGTLNFFFNALVATKTMMILGIIASGIFMYLLAREFFGEFGGLLSGILYLYAPYHAVDIYVRGDVSEFYAYAFIPLLAYGIWKTYNRPNVLNLVIGALGFTGIILSHNLTAFIATPFAIIGVLILMLLSKQVKTKFFLLGLFVLGFILSAFYVIPVFSEFKYTNVLSQIDGTVNFRDHFVCLNQLWDSPWGYGGSVKGCVDGLSFMIGKFQIIFGILGLISLVCLFRRKKKEFYIGAFMLFGLLLSVFLLLDTSEFIWNEIPIMAVIQYPWRFLILTSFFISMLGGGLGLFLQNFLSKRIELVLIVFAAIIIIAVNKKYFIPQNYYDTSGSELTKVNFINWNTSNLSHEYMPKNFDIPKNEIDIPKELFVSNQAKINIIVNKTREKKVVISSVTYQNIHINLAYFPGWNLYVNGLKKIYKVDNKGLNFSLKSGKNLIDLRYEETQDEILGDLISLGGFVLIVLGIIWKITKKYAKS